ncbi:MAG TPA: LytR C-terminal domain-containing protein [Sphingomicrobium sp.]|nr:LytR C-terminal domain-containing protein [Sphingomicrobium sp.]
MVRGGKLLAAAAIVATAGCGSERGRLEVRATPAPLSAGAKPVPFRIAEGQAQFALGNVALALESFRKALREDPSSIHAMAGIAACYDRMGRFDLSRRHYEAALAAAPGDPHLLAALASSLDLQGLKAEAASVRGEIASRIATAAASPPAPPGPQAPAIPVAAVPGPVPVAAMLAAPPAAVPEPAIATAPATAAVMSPEPVPASQPISAEPKPPVARSITVALPPADPAPVIAAVPALPDQPAVARRSPRLERMSMGEVALVTAGASMWKPAVTHREARSETVRWVPLREAQASGSNGIRLLNAARSQGLAARTRAYLVQRGWRTMAIGDAAETRPDSVVLYPASRRRLGLSLAAQFGFQAVPRASGSEITVLLGRDAAGHSALRAGG